MAKLWWRKMVNCQHGRAYPTHSERQHIQHRPKRFSIDLDLKSYFASCKIVMLNRSNAKTSIKRRWVSACVRACVCVNVVCLFAHFALTFSTQLTDATSSIRSKRELHIKMTCIYSIRILISYYTRMMRDSSHYQCNAMKSSAHQYTQTHALTHRTYMAWSAVMGAVRLQTELY